MKTKPIRIFIEVDIMNDYNKDSIESGIDACLDLSHADNKMKASQFFDQIICDARFHPNLFEAIKGADEVYMHTSIWPIVGGTNLGSPELWNGMMKMAVEQCIAGKKIFNAHPLKGIEWRNLNLKLFREAFKANRLFVAADDYSGWKKVSVPTIIKETKKKMR
jgi:hypothetical protein